MIFMSQVRDIDYSGKVIERKTCNVRTRDTDLDDISRNLTEFRKFLRNLYPLAAVTATQTPSRKACFSTFVSKMPRNPTPIRQLVPTSVESDSRSEIPVRRDSAPRQRLWEKASSSFNPLQTLKSCTYKRDTCIQDRQARPEAVRAEGDSKGSPSFSRWVTR